VKKKFAKVLKSPFTWISFLYLLSAKGHLEIVDTEYSVRTAKAIIENGSMLIEPIFKDQRNNSPLIPGTDKIYSQYGIGILAIFIPVILIAKFFSFASGLDETLLSHFILSFYNIPFAILGLWNFREILIALGQNTKISNFLMICLGLGTIFWKYVVTDFSEICQIAFILGAVNSYLCKGNKNRWILISGYLSLLILLKLVYVVVIPPFLILAFHEAARDRMLFKKLIHGAFLLVPVGLFLMFMNWIRYGSIFESGYGGAQSDFSIHYLLRDWKDYLISLDRGIIPYSPIILVGFFTIRKFFKVNKETLFLITTICISFYLLTASWVGWKGGYCWGNRNLVPLVPLICVSWAFLDWKNLYHRITFFLFFLISIPIQIVGISLKTHEWSVLSREFKDHPDPYYVPSEIEGSTMLFCEKLFNSSGNYSANTFVNEHHHTINLSNYESFIGFNFWPVHACKLIDSSLVGIMGKGVLGLSILVTVGLIIYFYPKSSKDLSKF
jgi:hypothetical protein